MRACPHCGVSILAPISGGQTCPACKQPMGNGNASATVGGVIPHVSEDAPTDPSIKDPTAVPGAVPVKLHVPPPPKRNAAGIEFDAEDPAEAGRQILRVLLEPH